MRRAVDICAFRCLKLPRSLTGRSVSLRRLAVSDAAFLQDAIGGQKSSGRWNRRWRGLSLWWWMRGRYTCAYVIRGDTKRVGLIGLYDVTLRPRPRAALSLIVKEEETRRRGYGGEAYDLLMSRIVKNHGLDEIEVAVAGPDPESLSFWEGLGFTQVTGTADPMILRVSLTNQ